MFADKLTPPEGYVQGAERRNVKRALIRDGGCAHCKHREHSDFLDRDICPRDPARSFPLCMKDQRTPVFLLDYSTIERGRDA